ncbi:hypothetical protein BC936DRAFT_141139 [Jimgerdemannia flammicorona]|uniref:Guanine nucleotide binding protein, alpha subunit n=1 Tax=Jimgerdemannia flammicorona TaxID=994334 RepID=A0A433A2U2_9FUNG|nr:hypothetical protein BC936DRAFT_141139 [Jimgerdemannia flammicorona]
MDSSVAQDSKYIHLNDDQDRTNTTDKSRSRNKMNLAEEREAKRNSDAIDKQLIAEKIAREKEKSAKLLLLGAAESGKTTVLKQIRIIHSGGLANERKRYQRIVYLNTINAMKALCAALISSDIPLTIPDYREHVEFITAMANTTDPTYMNGQSITTLLTKRASTDTPTASTLFQQAAPAIKALWGDAAIKEVYAKGLAKDIQDSAKYFLDNIDRISEDDYEPTDIDILQARVKTIGVTEHKFEIDSVVYRYITRVG